MAESLDYSGQHYNHAVHAIAGTGYVSILTWVGPVKDRCPEYLVNTLTLPKSEWAAMRDAAAAAVVGSMP